MKYSRENVLKKIFDLSPEVIAVLDKKGVILDINNRVKEWLGYDPEELIGKNLIMSPIATNKSKSIAMMNLGKRYLGNKIDPYELEFVKKDGQVVPAIVRANLLEDENGEKVFDLVMISEISKLSKEKKVVEGERDRVKKYIDVAGVMMVVLDREGKIVLVNRKACEILEYEEVDLLGESWFEKIILDEDKEEIKEVLKKVLDKEIWSEFHQNRVRTKSGKIKIIDWHNAFIKENDGLVGTLSSGLDVTEKIETQQKLDESEKKYKEVVTHSNQLFYIHDNDHNISFVSNYCEKMFGYTQEEMMIKWTDLTTDNPINQEGIKITEEIIRTGKEKKPYELELKRKNNETFWAEVRESPIKNDLGQVVGLSGSLTDITEKKKVDLELMKFKIGLERSEDIVFITNKEGIFEYINPSFSRVYGYSAEEVEGKTPRILKSGRQDIRVYESFWKKILSGKAIQVEFDNKAKDGKIVAVKVSANPVESGGEIIGFMAIQKNITKEREVKETDKTRTEELEKLNRLMVGREIKMAELKKKLQKYEPKNLSKITKEEGEVEINKYKNDALKIE